MNMRIGHIPVKVNPKTRESRLILSMPLYIWRSVSIILRSCITYRPRRTFFYCSLAPGLLGMAICIRFLYFYLFGIGSGHLQSLILAAVMLIISALIFALGILADLISENSFTAKIDRKR